MARGTALSVIVTMTKAELMVDTDTAVSPGGDALLKVQISNMQKQLALKGWPFLQVESTVALVAGTRYYDFPQVSSVDVFDLGVPIQADCYWSTLWNPVELGIDPQLYNSLNPALGQSCDPVTRWQLYRTAPTAALKLEVWPLPATAMTLRLRGQAVLPVLAADSDTAVLDDLLLAQFTAAKLAARMKSADAGALLSLANDTLRQLKSGYPEANLTFNGAGCRPSPRRWEDRPTVATMITP